MSQNSIDQIFKSKLAHQETDLSDKVSFEAVMARRSTKPKSGLLKPVLWGISGLVLVSTAAFFWVNRSSGSASGLASSNAAENSTSASTNSNNANEGESNATDHVSANSQLKNLGNDEYNNVRNTASQPSSSPKSTVSYSSNTDRAAQQPSVVYNASSSPESQQTISGAKNASEPHTPTIANKSEQVLKLSSQHELLMLDDRFINLTRYLGPNLFDFALGQADRGQTSILNIAPQHNYDRNSHNLTFELMLSAGRYQNGLLNFNGGTVTHALHNAGYYQGKVLFNLPSNPNIQLGVGLGFAQNSGSGQLTTQQTTNTMRVDSQVIVIVQPGMPNTNKTVYDTSFVKETKTQNGHINYTQSRINLPLTFNYLLGDGLVSFRVSGTVAPGMLIYQKGTLFSEGHTPSEIQTRYKASFDARLGFGLLLGLNNNTRFIIEPGIQYFSEKGQAQYGRLLPGVGVGLSFKY